jgi:YD repeat-containing protein
LSTSNPPPPPSPVGGVYLGGAGKSLTGLQRLKGFSFDPNTGNLILLAEDGGDIKLPPLRLDDVVTIFRSVYLHGEGPSVTIDPNPQDPTGPTMIVVHGNETPNSYPGWVLYEADRMMKTYNLGQDNISKADITTQVPGYAGLLHTIFFGGEFADGKNAEGTWERFWIVPAEVNRFRAASRELTIFDVPLKVKTQKMVWRHGELEDDPNGKSSNGARAFIDWFTRNYEPISNERYLLPPPETGITKPVPVFAELRRIALITAIAEQAREQGVPLPNWMKEYEVPKITVDETTPAMTVSKREENGNRIQKASVYGGVNLSPADDVVKTLDARSDLRSLPAARRELASEQIALADALAPGLENAAKGKQLLVPFPVQQNGHRFHAVALPGADLRALAPNRLAEVDLSVPFEGGGQIALSRRFNSFFQPEGPWGKSWTMDLPQLDEVKVPVERTDKAVTFKVAHDLSSPLGSIRARFSKSAFVKSLGLELTVPDGPSEILALAAAANPLVKSGTTKLIFKDGSNWYFDDQGRLAAVEQKPLLTLYLRDSLGNVRQIAGYNGDAVRAIINLNYNAQGRLDSAEAENAKGKETVSYAYDDRGMLNAVISSTGKISYGYERGLVKNVDFSSKNGQGALEAAKLLRGFEYGANGQLFAETAADGTRIGYQVEQLDGGSRLVVAGPGDSANAQVVSYDAGLRPLEWTQPDKTNTRWEYAADGAVQTKTTFPSGRSLQTSVSADGRYRTTATSDRIVRAEEYDDNGRLVAVAFNKRPIFTQQWHPDGSLKSVDFEAYSIIPGYDGSGRLSNVLRAKPAKDGKFDEWQKTLFDEAGRVKGVKDSTGSDIQVGYDSDDRVTGLVTTRDGKNFGFTIQRDADGKVERIHSSWGDEDCHYDAAGNLAQVVVKKGPATGSADYAENRIKSLTQFDQGRTQFDYYSEGEAKDRLKTLQTPAITLSYQYGADGALKSVDCGSVCQVSYDRDKNGNVEVLALTPVNGHSQ